MAEPEVWVLWSDDRRESIPHPAGGDIDTIHAGSSTSGLHIQMNTFGAMVSLVPPTSEVHFVVAQADEVSVRFVWDGAPMLWIDDELVQDGWRVSEASDSHGWHLSLDWALLSVSQSLPFKLQDLDAVARIGLLEDRATGPDLTFVPTPSGSFGIVAPQLQEGITIEGPDFGGGTSVTVDALGQPILAYYIYDGDRGAQTGIYLARIDVDQKVFVPERLSDVQITREHGGRDGQMRTQVAHDGANVFVLFTDDPAVDYDDDGPGHPGTPDSVFVLAHDGTQWVREDPTPEGVSDVGPEDVADLVAHKGRVVAAVPVEDDVWVVERTGPQSWQRLVRIEDATNAKLALDTDSEIHIAWVSYDAEENMRDGTLYYASSRGNFEPKKIGENLAAGWEGPETDGSFAIATGPSDEVAFLWNDGRSRNRSQEQRIAILEDGSWTYDYAPLSPRHGNPQYTMRLGYTGIGNLVASSGYGSSDSLAVRAPSGVWDSMDIPRFDVWDMAVASTGNIYFGYTQPHGGTTVALSVYRDPSGPSGPGVNGTATEKGWIQDREAPGFGVAGVLVLVGALCLRRRQSMG